MKFLATKLHYMNNFLIKILIPFLMLTSVAMSEEMEPPYLYREFNSYENPVYYKYMDNYLNILGEAFSKIKFYRINICVIFEYRLNKDGTISDFEVDPLSNTPLNEKKLRKLVENNLPPAFYEGMDREYVNMQVAFGTSGYSDSYSMDYFSSYSKDNEHCFVFDIIRKI